MPFFTMNRIPKALQNEESIMALFPGELRSKIDIVRISNGFVKFQVDREHMSSVAPIIQQLRKSLSSGSIPKSPLIKEEHIKEQPALQHTPQYAIFDVVIEENPDYTFLYEEMAEALSCPICMSLFKEPHRLQCGHVFCKKCISRCEDFNNLSQNCPICRDKIIRCEADLLAAQLVTLVRVCCPNAGLTCPMLNEPCFWSGSIEQLEYHLKESCPTQELKCVTCSWKGWRCKSELHKTACKALNVVSCSNRTNGCQWIGNSRTDMDSHLKICSFRPVDCHTCNWQGPYYEFDEHVLLCEERMIQCNNQGCSSCVKAKNLARHRSICRYRWYPCENQCGWTGSFYEFAQHEDECPNRIVSCGAKNCSWEGRLQEFDRHSDSCYYLQDVVCYRCGWNGIRDQLRSHLNRYH